MSYNALPDAGLAPGFYQQLPAGTPGWQDAPVPGWGINPMRSGPLRVGVGQYPGPHFATAVPWNDAVLPHYAPIGAVETTNWGVAALMGAGGIILGLTFGWLWFSQKKTS